MDQAWIVVFAGSKELFPDRPVGVLVVPDGLLLHFGAVARLGRRVVHGGSHCWRIDEVLVQVPDVLDHPVLRSPRQGDVVEHLVPFQIQN